MKTVTSVSGGQSSCYVAANYPADILLFALVTTEDQKCKHPDSYLRKLASEKIGREFIGTLEENVILETVLELEQWLQQEIHWVAGEPFEKVIEAKGNYLPNVMARYCTTELKIKPLFNWWEQNVKEPVAMQIGLRHGEQRRAENILDKCVNGLRQYNNVGWQYPVFPLIEDGIRRDTIVEYWNNIPIPFAKQNNCIGCFHRNPLVLRKKFEDHPKKMAWYVEQEEKTGGRWKREVSYKDIKKHRPQAEIKFEEWPCDSGYCGL